MLAASECRIVFGTARGRLSSCCDAISEHLRLNAFDHAIRIVSCLERAPFWHAYAVQYVGGLRHLKLYWKLASQSYCDTKNLPKDTVWLHNYGFCLSSEWSFVEHSLSTAPTMRATPTIIYRLGQNHKACGKCSCNLTSVFNGRLQVLLRNVTKYLYKLYMSRNEKTSFIIMIRYEIMFSPSTPKWCSQNGSLLTRSCIYMPTHPTESRGHIKHPPHMRLHRMQIWLLALTLTLRDILDHDHKYKISNACISFRFCAR